MKRVLVLTTIALTITTTLACQMGTPSPSLAISGTITGEGGQLLPSVAVLPLSPAYYGLLADPVHTDDAGRYHLELASGQDVLLFALPISGETVEGYHVHGHTVDLARVKAASGQVTQDFTLTPCHDFILEGYDAEGQLVPEEAWFGPHYAIDMAGEATYDLFVGADKGEGTISIPSVCVPLGKTRRFVALWTVPEFGDGGSRVIVTVDNDGAGYTADGPGGTVLDFNYELAHSQAARLHANVSAYETNGYIIPRAIIDDLAKTEDLLAQAAAETGAAKAALADQAAATASWALETLELARAKQDIPRYRMGNLTITIVDENGNPVPGVTFTYVQAGHDFLFGITEGAGGIEHMAKLQQAGVNQVSVGLFWDAAEAGQNTTLGEHDFAEIANLGFSVKAIPLLLDIGTIFELIEISSFGTFEQTVHEHISALAQNYGPEVDTWRLLNEAHGRPQVPGFSGQEATALMQTSIRAIREHDPEARVAVNSLLDWHGRARTDVYLETGKPDDFSLSIPAYIEHLESEGVDYDIIGIQLYNGGLSGSDDPFGMVSYDLAFHARVLDRLGTFGKPVHVTETSVSSTWGPDWAQQGAGWWHRPWDEETQVEFLRQLYTVAFSKPRVEAITWWDLNDADSFPALLGGGLLDEKGNPKPAYHALRDLIAEWTASGEGQTDSAGRLAIHGYGGEYELTITHNGQTWRKTVHVYEQQVNRIVIELETR
jgi:GH35 family endo-1,4-beta-xylanase